MNYDNEIKNSIKNQIISYNDIFDFKETPNEDLYEGFYNFCRENLNINSKVENIYPNIFLFTNSFSINAKANYKNNHGVILINMGLMQYCIENYFNNEELNEYINLVFPNYIGKFDNPTNILIFQIVTQFTYYHELAHLFQFCKHKNDFELQERNTNDEKFDIIKHKLEINADTYSSIAIATHIYQYIDKTFGDEINLDVVSDTIKILGAGLLNYIINFSDHINIYFRENSHPHPFLRVLNIILNISNYIEQMPHLIEKKISLNGEEIYKAIINFYQELEENKIFTTKFSDIVYKNSNFQKDIINYLEELLDFTDTGCIDAMDSWNKQII